MKFGDNWRKKAKSMKPKEIIERYLRLHGIHKKDLARMLNETPQTLSGKFAKNDFSTDYIRRICDALNHNFFEDFAREYNNESIEDWEKMMVEERPAAYSVTKEQEFNKWAQIIEKLPEELHYIRTQLEELNKNK